MTYTECKNFMDDYGFKKLYMIGFNQVNEKNGKKYNCWGYHKKNGKYGILDLESIWCWRNTLNTHPFCFFLLIKYYEEFTGNEFKISDNPLYYGPAVRKLMKFVDDNWELFFTKNIETKYYHEFAFACNRSWSTGQVTSITVADKKTLSELFPNLNIISVECDIERGNPDDFKGKDIIFRTDEREYSIQVKSGTYYFDEINQCYVVKSSVNDLRAECDFYCIVNVQKDKTNIIVFKNDITKIKKEYGYTIFKKETFETEMSKNIETTQKLMEILQFCGENKVLFNLTNTESENNIGIISDPGISFNISISNFEDLNLLKLLDEKFIELKNLIK